MLHSPIMYLPVGCVFIPSVWVRSTSCARQEKGRYMVGHHIYIYIYIHTHTYTSCVCVCRYTFYLHLHLHLDLNIDLSTRLFLTLNPKPFADFGARRNHEHSALKLQQTPRPLSAKPADVHSYAYRGTLIPHVVLVVT